MYCIHKYLSHRVHNHFQEGFHFRASPYHIIESTFFLFAVPSQKCTFHADGQGFNMFSGQNYDLAFLQIFCEWVSRYDPILTMIWAQSLLILVQLIFLLNIWSVVILSEYVSKSLYFQNHTHFAIVQRFTIVWISQIV